MFSVHEHAYIIIQAFCYVVSMIVAVPCTIKVIYTEKT